jgi:hypothetical protein
MSRNEKPNRNPGNARDEMKEKSVRAADSERVNGFRNGGQYNKPSDECHRDTVGYQNRD